LVCCADQGGGTFMQQTGLTVSGTRAAWPLRSEAGAPALPVQLCPPAGSRKKLLPLDLPSTAFHRSRRPRRAPQAGPRALRACRLHSFTTLARRSRTRAAARAGRRAGRSQPRRLFSTAPGGRRAASRRHRAASARHPCGHRTHLGRRGGRRRSRRRLCGKGAGRSSARGAGTRASQGLEPRRSCPLGGLLACRGPNRSPPPL